MKRTATTILATAALLLAATGCGGDDPAGSTNADGSKQVTLTLNWVPYGEHAPFYYGLQKGYYSAEGIDLKILPGNGSGNTVKQVAQKQTDFGWADSPVLLKSVASGMPVRSLGVVPGEGPLLGGVLHRGEHQDPGRPQGQDRRRHPRRRPLRHVPGVAGDQRRRPGRRRGGQRRRRRQDRRADRGQVDAHPWASTTTRRPTIENKTGKEVASLPFADFGMNLLGTGLLADDPTLAERPRAGPGDGPGHAGVVLGGGARGPGRPPCAAMDGAAPSRPPDAGACLRLSSRHDHCSTVEEAPAPGVNTEAAVAEDPRPSSREHRIRRPGRAQRLLGRQRARRRAVTR